MSCMHLQGVWLRILGKIPNRIIDYISYTDIFDIIRARKEAIEIVQKSADPIIMIIIDLLKWENENNYEKLLDDLDYLLKELKYSFVYRNQQQLSYSDYYSGLYVGPVEDDVSVIDDFVDAVIWQKNGAGRCSKDLREIRTNEEIIIPLEKFMNILSQKLSKKEYRNAGEIWDQVNI